MPIRVTNIQAGYYDKHGFHPLRRSADYDPDRASDDYGSRRDSTGLRYGRKSKSKRAHKFVRGVAVNPQHRWTRIPALASWNVYAGGTGVFDQRHNYDLYTETGHQYSISARPGKRTGYSLSVFPGEHGGHQDLGRFGSPQAAVSMARRHHSGLGRTSNPIPTRWTPAKVMRTKRGEVKVMIPQHSSRNPGYDVGVSDRVYATWKKRGRTAARSGKFTDKYAAWRAAKQKKPPTGSGKWQHAREAFETGFSG